MGLSPPHHPFDFPPVKKNKFQTAGGQERRCCVSIKLLSGPGCLEMVEIAKKLFHSIKVDVITGSVLSALSVDTGRHSLVNGRRQTLLPVPADNGFVTV